MTLSQVSGYQKGQQFPLWHKADISMQARVCPLLGRSGHALPAGADGLRRFWPEAVIVQVLWLHRKM